MAFKVSKRFLSRARPALRRYQKVLAEAQHRDVNESDTSVIVSDFLSDVLGYDKYQEVTTEYAVRSTYCDLAVTCDGRLCYLIEVKPIGADLRDNHVRQAVDYGAKEGCEWVILTNGAEWHAYRIRFEQPLDYELAFAVNLLAEGAAPADLLPYLSLIAKESSSGKEIDRFWRQKQATSRYVIAQVLLQERSLRSLRRELRKLSPDVRISCDQLAALLRTELLKREALEGEKAIEASKLVRRVAQRQARESAEAKVVPPAGTATVDKSSTEPSRRP